MSYYLTCIYLVVLQRLVRDFYKILNQVNTEEIPADLKLPDSFNKLVSEMKNNQYDARTFAFMLRAMVCYHFLIFYFTSFPLVVGVVVLDLLLCHVTSHYFREIGGRVVCVCACP